MPLSRTKLRITQAGFSGSDSSLDAIRERLKAAVSGESCRAVGLRTNTHPETVRRYLSTGNPSVEFLIAVIRGYDVSCTWLLLGIGPQKQTDVAEYIIQSSPLSQLLRGIAEKLSAAEEVGRLSSRGMTTQLRMTNSLLPEITARARDAADSVLNSTST